MIAVDHPSLYAVLLCVVAALPVLVLLASRPPEDDER